MKRKNLITILVGLLVVSLSACGSAASIQDEVMDQPEDAEVSHAVPDSSETVVEAVSDVTTTSTADLTHPIVDTNQGTCYDNSELIDCLAEGEAFYGQDAQYTGLIPSYTDNGDGTIYAWALSSGYNVDMAGYDLHGAGSLIFVSKTEENSGIEDSVPVMVLLVRDGDVTETPAGDPSTVKTDRVVVFEDGDTGMGGQGGGEGGEPDFVAAAETLGISEEVIREAMGDPDQGPPDFAAAAEQLGITEQELMDALGVSSDGDQPPADQP